MDSNMPIIYEVWDWWKEKNIYYALVCEYGTLYFSEAKIPENLEEIDENG